MKTEEVDRVTEPKHEFSDLVFDEVLSNLQILIYFKIIEYSQLFTL